MNRILLTFTGFHDPYTSSVVAGDKQAGPIISMLEARAFDTLVLFKTPGARQNTENTVEAVSVVFPDVTVLVKDLPDLVDPTKHVNILRYLRSHIRDILESFPEAQYSISISSGTPSMHACWLLLVADGSIPANILYGHPPRNATETYKVSEVDLGAPEFPEITPKKYPVFEEESYVADLASVCDELHIEGTDKTFLDALDRAARLAEYDCHILVLGETGTGKEQVAKLIHRISGRRKDRFIAVNCAALPKDLAESILFGHEKGAFTGASQSQEGEFVRANGGTLFLDEIGEMSPEMQAKLLRVLQDKVVKPIGGKERVLDVRVVAATNMDITKAIRDGNFRPDLAQRFIDSIELPPLRRRRGDIIKLATFTLTRWNREYGGKRKISRKALDALQSYSWPGNVRELVSAVERAAMMAKKDIIQTEDFRLGEAAWSVTNDQAGFPEPYIGFSLRKYLADARESLIYRALELADNNGAHAAKLLSISSQAVNKFLKEQDDANFS